MVISENLRGIQWESALCDKMGHAFPMKWHMTCASRDEPVLITDPNASQQVDSYW